jgi:hypothetical protein
VDLDSPGKLQAALQAHESTRGMRQFTPGDPELGDRLGTEAAHELDLMLAVLYRLGFRDLLVYPFRAQATRSWRGPSTSAGTGPAAA